MKILAVTHLFPNPVQPNRSTYNRQQFTAIAAQASLEVIAPIRWTAGNRSSTTVPAYDPSTANISAWHPRFWYTPGLLRGYHGHFYQQSISGRFKECVRRSRPDVVFGSWAYPDGWAAVRLAKRHDLPVVVKVHGSDINSLPGSGPRYRRTLEALQSADAVIAVSSDLAAKIADLGVPSERVHRVYNGVDTSTFCPGSKQQARQSISLDNEDPLLVFVGNLEPVKGIDTLVEACRHLRTQGVSYQCRILGGGSQQQHLESLIVQEDLQDFVQLAGRQLHASIPAWLQAADVVALPSRSEGVPNVLLEANACGTPFVASNVGGIPEIQHHHPQNRLFPQGDASAMATALTESLTSEPVKVDIGELPDWDSSARNVLDVLESVIPPRPPNGQDSAPSRVSEAHSLKN